MIIVYFYYRKKGEKHMPLGERVFYDRLKALRFMYSIANRDMVLDGWSAYDPYDDEWLHKRINVDKINAKALPRR